MKEHDLLKVKISDLKFDKSNPNQLTREQMAALRESMQRFGYLTPIVVDQDLNIADGEHRALIYKEFGLDEIPAFKLNLKDDTERRMLRQVMNKLHGEHDKQLDADELVKIFEGNRLEDLSKMIAAQQDDLKRLINRYHPEIAFSNPEDFDEINEDEFNKMVPETQLGDIYELGNHRLMCADCSSEKSRRGLFEDKTLDIILTDPPYSSGGFQEAGKASGSVGTRQNASLRNDMLSTRGYTNLMTEAIGTINAEVLYLFTDWRMWCYSFDISERCGFGVRNMIVWDKGYFGMGFPWRSQHELILYGKKSTSKNEAEGNKGNVLQAKRTGNINHPTEKPTSLLKELLDNTVGENVYDPFAGSGSTLIACEQTNRHCFAMEIDPRYCDVIVKRWEKYTGKKAVKKDIYS